MADTLALSVVVPVFNEEDNVGPLLAALTAVLSDLGRPYEILVVDDGSTDGTLARLREAVDALPGPPGRAAAGQLRADGGAGGRLRPGPGRRGGHPGR